MPNPSTVFPRVPLYTAEQRARRDATGWTMVQGILAPVQFLAFGVSVVLVLRYLATGDGYGAATISILVKTGLLYAIMVTGAIWEKVVFGQYLFAPAFFWEDLFSLGVVGLHTAYIIALFGAWLTPAGLMVVALAALGIGPVRILPAHRAAETFHQVVRHLARPMARTAAITCNLPGATAPGFRHRDDITEMTQMLAHMGVTVNVCAPFGATPADIARMGAAHFKVLLYPETGESAARYCEKTFGQKYTKVTPIGVEATRDFLAEVSALTGLPVKTDVTRLRQPWWSASVDRTYLTGKRVYLFGDATHVTAAARIARDEIGFEVVGRGACNREFAHPLRGFAKGCGVEALISDDCLEVEAAIAAVSPELILGTQMERHIAKRLGIPCAVISSPVHVQDFPARYAPQMGYEGANVIFDAWVHPLVMGLEEHLLTMFREDFEFHDDAGASHHGASHHGAKAVDRAEGPAREDASGGDISGQRMPQGTGSDVLVWLAEAERALKKIPFFVRGKAKRNTGKFAADKGLRQISVETLYEAKARYAR